MGRKVAVVIVAGWLLASAYAWPHNPGQRINTVVVALALAASTALWFRFAWARWLNIALAAWLLISVSVGDKLDPRTFWNNAAVAFAVYVLSMLGTRRTWRDRYVSKSASSP